MVFVVVVVVVVVVDNQVLVNQIALVVNDQLQHYSWSSALFQSRAMRLYTSPCRSVSPSVSGD